MKTIGLIGGITWHSTLDYYRMLNQMTNERVGGVASARIILISMEFDEIKSLTEADRWDDLFRLVSESAIKLQRAGADCILIGANTMHKIADQVQQSINIPLINIAGETAKEVASRNMKKVALLGTKYTMQFDFFHERLARHGIETIIPLSESEIEYINDAIYKEMSKGEFKPKTKEQFVRIIDGLIARGAEGVIFGCTEIPILIKPDECPVPSFDTTHIHTTAAINFSLP